MLVNDALSSYLVPRWVLLVVRILFAAFSLMIMIWKLCIDKLEYFRYLTTISWTGITIYFIMMSIVSIVYRDADLKTKFPRGLALTIQFLFSTTQTLAMIVLTIFWALLQYILESTSDRTLLFLIMTPHIANLVMMQIELWLTKIKLPLLSIGFTLLSIFLYTLWVWLAKYGFDIDFPYRFFANLMDIRKTPGMSIAWVIAFLAIFTIMSLIIWAESLIRDRLMRMLVGENEYNSSSESNVVEKNMV
ncbi:hypothetical protein QVD99_008535 [Batrachochytrium dendrobatidis]|nr:hypothetical protein O5D80_007404 [Batrachochytrium dendrobatidis]KAK5665000.1 hypothetical protein QVD99_008535 [Batrachochytrium dendrobatidis]